jgi:hypothetical protein
MKNWKARGLISQGENTRVHFAHEQPAAYKPFQWVTDKDDFLQVFQLFFRRCEELNASRVVCAFCCPQRVKISITAFVTSVLEPQKTADITKNRMSVFHYQTNRGSYCLWHWEVCRERATGATLEIRKIPWHFIQEFCSAIFGVYPLLLKFFYTIALYFSIIFYNRKLRHTVFWIVSLIFYRYANLGDLRN